MNIAIKKLYYKYFDTTTINHYRLLILTEEYRNIGIKYFNKYPRACGWINLNKELFDTNKYAEKEYNIVSKRQREIVNDFFNSHNILCNKCKNNEYSICSDQFEKKYLQQKYHYEQNPKYVIEDIMSDIARKNCRRLNESLAFI